MERKLPGRAVTPLQMLQAENRQLRRQIQVGDDAYQQILGLLLVVTGDLCAARSVSALKIPAATAIAATKSSRLKMARVTDEKTGEKSMVLGVERLEAAPKKKRIVEP